jgi:hypothetical protein
LVIGQESLQQQHASFTIAAADCNALCAEATPANVNTSPSTRPGTNL